MPGMRNAPTRLLLLALCAAGCADAAPEATQELRFSVLPDWNKGKLADDAAALAALLSERLARPVRYQPCNDYPACVNALAANKIDFVWLGGKTTCDAIDVGEGHVHVLATRDIDLEFKSYFIGNADAVAAGKIDAVDDLADWRGTLSDVRFTFGSINSTSGHLMPRHFLLQAGIVPEQAFATVGYQKLGGHAATLELVASGAYDVGALNYAYYDQAAADKKQQAVLLHTTDTYVDYAWVAHDRIGEQTVAALRDALLELDRDDPREARILDGWAAGAFVAAEDAQWQSIRQVRDSLPKGFLDK